MKKLLFEVSAPVRASLTELRALVDGEWLATAIGGGPATTVRAPGMVGAQGGWWYRGEYTAEEDGARVRLVHRVFNVAEWGAWGVPPANRFFLGFRPRLQAGIDELARRAEEHLDAAGGARS